ncbi:2,3-bisphosphoglycerate-dependent phosphoglycerate mutase [Plakobranchus ocellatus]|uniref:phosphoglycerate mutase (2,3-diphosphoglycerate-dependent) n=1 Tax=Plakobranchus ocellatus TaxID=259542 RepID=A0AAV3ZYF4_9GAST|nr:2,3-bisphosphoglycerate-dependent phosphoglycerate mutase [Plakobranchus ocellatus]
MATGYSVVLVRHAQSEFNRDKIYTGWCDSDLTSDGVKEAKNAGKILCEYGFEFDLAFTSVLKRAIKTLYFIQDELDCHWIPVTKTWLLNERHFGKLQGRSKAEVLEQYGQEQVHRWNHALHERPPPLAEMDEHWNGYDRRYAGLPFTPVGESLQQTLDRSLQFWHNLVVPALKAGQKPLICGHGCHLRNLIKHLDSNCSLGKKQLETPNAAPFVLHLDSNMRPANLQFLTRHGNDMVLFKSSRRS